MVERERQEREIERKSYRDRERQKERDRQRGKETVQREICNRKDRKVSLFMCSW